MSVKIADSEKELEEWLEDHDASTVKSVTEVKGKIVIVYERSFSTCCRGEND